MVEEVWTKYDADNSGVLEKGEAMKFLRDTFKELFGTDKSDEQLLPTFEMIDRNKNNNLDKAELMVHIKGLIYGEANIDWDDYFDLLYYH